MREDIFWKKRAEEKKRRKICGKRNIFLRLLTLNYPWPPHSVCHRFFWWEFYEKNFLNSLTFLFKSSNVLLWFVESKSFKHNSQGHLRLVDCSINHVWGVILISLSNKSTSGFLHFMNNISHHCFHSTTVVGILKS